MTTYTISNGVTSTGLSLNNGDMDTVLSGGTASGTAVNQGASELVQSGGLSVAAAVGYGGTQTVFGTAVGATLTGDTNEGQSAVQDVGAGGFATGTTLASGGVQNVLSGGLVTSGFVGLASQIIVSAGGVASSSIASGSYASVVVSSGGVAQGMVGSAGGSLEVSSGGAAYGAMIGNAGTADIASGGTLTDLTVLSGGGASDLGTVNLVDGNLVSAILVIGTLNVAPGSEIFGAFQNFGTVDLLAGAAEPFLVISGSGVLKVESGSTFGTAVTDAGSILLESGAVISGVVFSGGGSVDAMSGAVMQGDTLDTFSGSIQSGAAVDGLTLNGSYVELAPGAVITDTVINTSRGLYTSSGSLASNTVVNSGGFVSLDGAAANVTVNSGGSLYYYSGGTATGAVVNAGGVAFVYSSGVATGETLVGSSYEEVFSGGVADGTVVSSGGYQQVSSGGVANSAVLLGGGSYVYAGGLAVGAAVETNGAEIVLSGGAASATAVEDGGYQLLSSGGAAVDTVVNSGGLLIIFDPASTATDTIVSSGGTLQNAGVTSGAVLSGGTEMDGPGGVSFGTDIVSGGAQVVSSGGTATSSTIGTGGTLHLLSGGTAAGAIQFAGPAAVLLIDGTTMPTVPIEGFTYNEAIDISALDYASSATLTIGEDDLVTIAVPFGGSESLTIAGASTDVFSLSPLEGGGTQITLVGPAPSLLALSPGSDTGTVGDGITTIDTPLITGTGVPGDTITLYDGTAQVGTALVGTDGTWSASTSALALGPHSLVAAQTDAFGNVSAGSSPLAITVLPAPPAPALALSPASDSGALGDGITNTASPVITGTGVAGNTVTLFDGVTAIGSATVASDGTWSIGTEALDDGPHPLTAILTDADGNESPASPAIALFIDTSVPPPPAALALAPASDSGVPGDDITNVTTPAITGTGTPGSTVTLYEGETSIGTGLVGQGGTWSIGVTLAAGPHSLTALQTDVAGTSSAASAPLVLSIQTAVPGAPGSLALAPSSDTGTVGDGVTTVTTPVITGTGIPGDQITLNDGTAVAGTGTVGGDGTWSIATTLAGGVHALTATQADVAGNVSPASPAFALTIGATTAVSELFLYGQGTAPVALGIPAPSSGAYGAGQLALAVVTLPTNGSVTLADGTALVAGQALTGAQLSTLLFTPVTGTSSTFVYSVTDPGGGVVDGTITLEAASNAPQISTAGQIPNDPSPTITGTAVPGSPVTLRSNGVAIGSATADPSTGAFSITAATPLALGLDRLTVTTVLSNGVTTASAPLIVFDVQSPVASVSTTDFSSADIGSALNQGAALRFVTGTQAVQLTDGTLSVGTDTGEATIQRLYEGLLGRVSDSGGISFYDAQLITGASPSSIAAQIMASPEYATQGTQTDTQFVATLYTNLLGRSAGSDAGFSYWTGLLASGASRADVAVGIVGATESKTDQTGVTAQLFVTHAPGLLAHELYETGLGREVDLSALGNVDAAFAAITPAVLANQIASSPEFTSDHAGQTNAAYVNSLYLAGLGRAADASASYWTGLLDSGGASRADVLLGIATTAEAQSHLTSNLTQYR